MNVEKLKRVNALAETLRQQGIAANSEDAVDMAAKISGSKAEEEFSQIKVDNDQKIVIRDHNTGDVIVEEPTQQTLSTEKKEQETFSREEVVHVLQSFADQFIKEVDKLSKRVSEQNRTIALLQSKLDDLPRAAELATEPAPIGEKIEEEKVEAPSVQQKLGELKETEEAPAEVSAPENSSAHPRSGGYDPDDVSIDKIFYCGQT